MSFFKRLFGGGGSSSTDSGSNDRINRTTPPVRGGRSFDGSIVPPPPPRPSLIERGDQAMRDMGVDMEQRDRSSSRAPSAPPTTPTGLTSGQFDSLATGQNNLRSGLMTFQDFTAGEFDAVGQDIGNLRNLTTDQFGNVIGGIDDLGEIQRAGFDATGRALFDQNQLMGQGFTGLTQDVAGVGSQVGGVGQAVDQGFAGVGDQFSAMGGTLADLGSDVGQGFSTLGQQVGTGFSDLGTSMGDQFSAAEQDRMQGFQGLSNQVGTGFAGQSDFLTNLSSNVLGGQRGISDTLADQGNRMNLFYGDLAQGQQGITQQLGGVGSDLSTLATDVDRDARIAEQDRVNIQRAVANESGRIRDDLGSVEQARAMADQRLLQSVSGVGNQVGQVGMDTTRMLSSAEQQRSQDQQEFAQRIDRVRNLLQTTGDSLNQNARQQYTDLANSFDSQGQLIASAVDQQGVQITRAVDQQGNLLINRFDQNGNALARNLLSIPDMLDQAAMFEQQLAMNTVPQQGFAGTPLPFAETRG